MPNPETESLAIVILPGLHGTGGLHAEFVQALGSRVRASVIAYPADRVLGYRDLEEFVLARLPPAGPYVLLGESFSGPIALAIAASNPPGLLGVILCASFASSPFPKLRALAPLLRFFPPAAMPRGLLSWVMLGRWSSPRLLEAIRSALLKAHPKVLQARAAAVLNADVQPLLERLSVPLLYLRPTQDRLIPFSAAQKIASACPYIEIARIAGPHFLLQAQPAECARIVRDFAVRAASGSAISLKAGGSEE